MVLMKTLVFDPYCGAAGDMIIGCLVDLGANQGEIKWVMERAARVEVAFEKVERGPITATHALVRADEANGPPTLGEIKDRVKDLGLGAVEPVVLRVFERLGRAEMRVHGAGEVHFHEVGAEDAIADIVGACTALHHLDVDEVVCTPIGVGGGHVNTAHGLLPVPAPATLEVLRESGLTWRGGPVDHELLTPTGAALLAEFVDRSVEAFPQLRAQRVGYGAGTKDLEIANALRGVIGEMSDGLVRDEITLLETNVDDVTGEVLGNLIERLMGEGARDVTILPATMKKGRPGHVVKVVATPDLAERLSRVIVEETGSLGVRILPAFHRLIARRHVEEVEVEVGGRTYRVGVKVATDTNDNLLDVGAEYDDAKRVAREAGVPIRRVLRLVEEEAWDRKE